MTRINIDDDMIERAAKWLYEIDRGVASWESASECERSNYTDFARAILQAALDCRTGPKDRRVEWDDAGSRREFRSLLAAGRRDDDMHFGWLPRKSDRLKREAEEREKQKAQKIHVSEDMLRAADLLRAECGYRGFDKPSDAQIYRAMRLQEMKERGQ